MSRCPRIHLNSDTISPGTVSDPTGEGLSLTSLTAPVPHVRRQLQAHAVVCACQQLASQQGFPPPALARVSLLEQPTELRQAAH